MRSLIRREFGTGFADCSRTRAPTRGTPTDSIEFVIGTPSTDGIKFVIGAPLVDALSNCLVRGSLGADSDLEFFLEKDTGVRLSQSV